MLSVAEGPLRERAQTGRVDAPRMLGLRVACTESHRNSDRSSIRTCSAPEISTPAWARSSSQCWTVARRVSIGSMKSLTSPQILSEPKSGKSLSNRRRAVDTPTGTSADSTARKEPGDRLRTPWQLQEVWPKVYRSPSHKQVLL